MAPGLAGELLAIAPPEPDALQPSSGAGDVGVTVVTAASGTERIRAAMQGGAACYLLKPFGFPALQEKLLAYAERRGQLGARRAVDQETVGQGSGSSPGTPARTAAAEASSGHCSARRRATTSWR